jgi:RimJ/RimL family protein N-acetyltransferase
VSFRISYERLAGRHVVLEPIAIEHAQGLFAAGGDRDDWAYLPIPGFSKLEDASAWVTQALELRAQNLHYTFVLVDPVTTAVIGSSRYLNVRERDRGLEIGYTWLARSVQRTAVNTEAKLLLLGNAFERCNALRVELKTDARNVRSQNAIARLGARREGVLRKHMITQDGYVRDTVLYSIVDDEWPAVKSELERKLRAQR